MCVILISWLLVFLVILCINTNIWRKCSYFLSEIHWILPPSFNSLGLEPQVILPISTRLKLPFVSSLLYHRQQNKWYPQRCQIVTKTAVNCSTLRWKLTAITNLTYSLRPKSSVPLKHLWGTIYFAGDSTSGSRLWWHLTDFLSSWTFLEEMT